MRTPCTFDENALRLQNLSGERHGGRGVALDEKNFVIMARALYSGVGIAGMSGSINKNAGGTTFSKNGVVRRRVVPVNPQSADQSEIRSAFEFLTKAWSLSLNDSQRLSWETARTGNVYYYKQDPLTGTSRPYASAKDLFIAMNFNWLITDESLAAPYVSFNVPGNSAGQDAFGITSVVADDSSNTLVITYTGTQTNEKLFLRATPPVSVGNQRVTSIISKMRLIEVISSSPDTMTGYQAKFGALTGLAGMKIFYEIVAVDLATGVTRTISSSSTVIVA